jgi:hypothetical protein
MTSDMKTYTDRSNCIRAARNALGPNARPDHDFYLLGGTTAWQWQRREEQGEAARKAEARGLPPILKRKAPAKRFTPPLARETAELEALKGNGEAKREALAAVLAANAPETASRANPLKTRAALKAKPPKGRAAPASAHKIAQNGGSPKLGKRAQIEADAAAGKLPPAPDLSAMTHKRWRGNLDDLVKLVKEKNIKALKRYVVKPGGSSHNAVERYRRLSIMALEARANR